MKTKTICVRFDAATLARIKAQAKVAGNSVAGQIRALVKIGTGLAMLLLIINSADAVTVLDLRLNCAGLWLDPGVTLTSTSCGGQGLWLTALVAPFPVPAPVTIRFALTLDGVLAGEEFRVLENVPCDHCQPGQPQARGMGWRLPLDGCCDGRLVRALASLELIGGSDPEVEFTLDVPTPEPLSMALLGVTLFSVGWVARKRRRR